MPDPRVQVVVEAVDHASNTLDRIGSNLNTSLRRVSMGLLLVGGVVTAFSGLAVKAATDQRIAVDRVRFAMEMLGDSFEARRENIDNLIGEVGKLTGFSKTELLDTFGRLIDATGSIETASKALPAVALLAKGAGITLSEGLNLVVAAIGGDKGALETLRRLGVQLTDTANPFQVLTDTQKRFKEQVEAGKTPLAELLTSVQDLRAEIGENLLPILEKVAEELQPLIDGVTNFAKEHPKIVGAITAIGGGLLILGGLIKIVRILWMALSAQLIATGIKFLVSNPIGWIILAVLGLITVALLLWKNWDKIWDWIVDKARTVRDFFVETWETTWEGLKILGTWLKDTFWPDWDKIWGWIVDKARTVRDFVVGAALKIWAWLKWLGSEIKDIFWPNWSQVWDWIKEKAQGFVDWLRDTFQPIWDRVWGALGSVVEDAARVMRTALDPLHAIIQGFLALIHWIESKLNRLPGPPSNIVPIPQPMPPPPGLAHGGVTAGGLALVGERGPELAMFPGGTRIIPNNQLGGGGLHIEVNINGPVYGLSDLDRHIVETIRRHVNAGGFHQVIFPSGRSRG